MKDQGQKHQGKTEKALPSVANQRQEPEPAQPGQIALTGAEAAFILADYTVDPPADMPKGLLKKLRVMTKQ